MTIADTSRIKMAIVRESAYAQNPAANVQILRVTGETLKQNTQTTQSTEIRADRQVPDIVRTSVSAGGDISGDFHYASWDKLIKSALFAASDFASLPSVITQDNISFVAATKTITDYAALGSFTTVSVGDWLLISGTLNGQNDVMCRVATKADNDTITIEFATLVDETGAVARDISFRKGVGIANGTTRDTHSIARQYTDLSNDYAAFRGMAVDTMSLEFQVGQIGSISFGFLGAQELSLTAQVGNGTEDAANTNRAFNGIDQIQGLVVGGVEIDATQFSMQLRNNVRAREKLGTLGAFEQGSGTLNVAGSLAGFYDGPSKIADYLNFAESSIYLKLRDTRLSPIGGYVFEIAGVVFTDGSRNAPGQNQDVFANLSYEGKIASGGTVTVRVWKF